MSSPENINTKPNKIQFTPETVDVTESMAEQGITPRPAQAQSITDDKRTIAKTTDPVANMDPAKIVVVPADEKTAKSWSKGSDSEARTWSGVAILRAIHMALKRGFQAVVGK